MVYEKGREPIINNPLSPHEFMQMYISSRLVAREGILQQLAAVEDELIRLGALKRRTKERRPQHG